MNRKFDLIAIGTGAAASQRRPGVALRDGRWRWWTRDRLEAPARCEDAIPRRFLWALRK